MEIKTNTTGSNSTFEKIAVEENEIYIRIFFPDGRFINYLINPADVENLGLGTIFEVIDPDIDFIKTKKSYANVEQKLKLKRKRKTAPSLVS
jgi:hypothetical protein